MTTLNVAPEMLATALFGDAMPRVAIVGASFDFARQVIRLQIEGPDVPDVPEVTAVVTKTYATVRFVPVDQPR